MAAFREMAGDMAALDKAGGLERLRGEGGFIGACTKLLEDHNTLKKAFPPDIGLGNLYEQRTGSSLSRTRGSASSLQKICTPYENTELKLLLQKRLQT